MSPPPSFSTNLSFSLRRVFWQDIALNGRLGCAPISSLQSIPDSRSPNFVLPASTGCSLRTYHLLTPLLLHRSRIRSAALLKQLFVNPYAAARPATLTNYSRQTVALPGIGLPSFAAIVYLHAFNALCLSSPHTTQCPFLPTLLLPTTFSSLAVHRHPGLPVKANSQSESQSARLPPSFLPSPAFPSPATSSRREPMPQFFFTSLLVPPKKKKEERASSYINITRGSYSRAQASLICGVDALALFAMALSSLVHRILRAIPKESDHGLTRFGPLNIPSSASG